MKNSKIFVYNSKAKCKNNLTQPIEYQKSVSCADKPSIKTNQELVISKRNIQKLLARCVFFTGSLSKLSSLSGISKSTLRRITKEKHRTNIATILRLSFFIDEYEKRLGRPLKKEG